MAAGAWLTLLHSTINVPILAFERLPRVLSFNSPAFHLNKLPDALLLAYFKPPPKLLPTPTSYYKYNTIRYLPASPHLILPGTIPTIPTALLCH